MTELCRELAKLGVKVGLSDARPALSARGALAERKLWIEVDLSGGTFVWPYDGQARHGLDDPAGAAAQIAEYLRLRDAGPGDRS
ncbi:hypothetical protein [Actinoallomurus liliacearum]|uniref:hypothetical protein n=1 Tax=Actinoallomurus liliacearum TaxID=1080073 RepID=UPI0031ECAB10